MPALATHRFTVEDFYRMAGAVGLPPHARPEAFPEMAVDVTVLLRQAD